MPVLCSHALCACLCLSHLRPNVLLISCKEAANEAVLGIGNSEEITQMWKSKSSRSISMVKTGHRTGWENRRKWVGTSHGVK